MMQGAAFRVLVCFEQEDTHTFVELCKQAGYASDLGGYYVRQLVSAGYLEKVSRGAYIITPKGKSQLAVHKKDKKWFVTLPRLSVLLIAESPTGLVVQLRAIQPFIGMTEWPAGVVDRGEALDKAVARITYHRFGIVTDAACVGFFRRIDLYEEEVFDDKLFAVHMLRLQSDILTMRKNNVGELLVCNEASLSDIARPARSLLDILAYARHPHRPYEERIYELQPEDLGAGVSEQES
jgi:predicted transcriptional regulator